LKEFYTLLGITLSDATLDTMIGTRPSKSVRYRIAEDTFRSGESSNLRILLNKLFKDDRKNDVPLKNNNPLYSEAKVIGELASLEMKNSSDPLFGTSHRTAEKKTAYAFTHHTYESRTFQELKRPGSKLA